MFGICFRGSIILKNLFSIDKLSVAYGLTNRINFIFLKLLQYMCLLVIMLLFVTGIKNKMKNTFTIIGCFPSCKDKNRFIVNPFTLKLFLICAREMVDLSCITLVKQCYAMTRCFFFLHTVPLNLLHYIRIA